MFLYGENSNFIIDSIQSNSNTDLEACKNFCSINPECAGLFIKDNEQYYKSKKKTRRL